MATDKDFAHHLQKLLADCGDVLVRPMMGEYIVKYRDKTIGGLYNNRFLVKPTKTAVEMLPDASLETPYPGAKDMLHVEKMDDLEDIPKLRILFEAMYEELPAPKPRKKKTAGSA